MKWALLLLAACSAAPVVPPPVVVAGCQLTRPPPVRPSLHFVPPPTCPAPWTACLTQPDAAALRVWQGDVKEWEEAVWESCRK